MNAAGPVRAVVPVGAGPSSGAPGTGSGSSLWQRVDRADLARALCVAAAAVAASVLVAVGVPTVVVAVFSVAALVAGCWPILTEAWEDIRGRRMSMELSMLIAIAAAALIGEWVTALLITAFVLAAEILEDLSMDRGRDALTDLMAFLPAAVQVREGERAREIPLDDVHPGMVVSVAPGGRIPVDGRVLAGSTEVDQSRITGESLPVAAGVGDTVLAGSIALSGALEIRVDRAGEDSSYGQIIATVREAQASQAPVQRLADRLATWLVLIALAAAALTFLLTRDARSSISVVIVAGACGIAAGTPLAILASIARAARSGAFVKDGTHMEQLARVDTVMIDKTGTLTEGQARVVAARPAGRSRSDLLGLAASAEWHSEHPFGQAILRAARDAGAPTTPPDSSDYRPGLGITAMIDGAAVAVGNERLVPVPPAVPAGRGAPSSPETPQEGTTQVHVSVDGGYAGSIDLADRVRDGAAAAIADLRGMGLRVVMLTGDSQAVARHVAAAVGVDEVRAELLPDQKHSAIEAERAAGHSVAMVGDGVNDAPSLARADVGIAVGSGTDIARESSDVVLVSSDLRDLVETFRIARRARRIVMANFIGTLAVDALGMALAALGWLGPVAAALVHVGSESAFILNSARLIPPRARAPRASSRPR